MDDAAVHGSARKDPEYFTAIPRARVDDRFPASINPRQIFWSRRHSQFYGQFTVSVTGHMTNLPIQQLFSSAAYKAQETSRITGGQKWCYRDRVSGVFITNDGRTLEIRECGYGRVEARNGAPPNAAESVP